MALTPVGALDPGVIRHMVGNDEDIRLLLLLGECEGGMDAGGPAPADSPADPRNDVQARRADVLRLGQLELATPSSRNRHSRRRRRWLRRVVRRVLGTGMAVGLLAGITFAGLFLVTPPVGNARALARTLDRAHHGTYLARPVPGRVAAALVAAEDQRFYAEASGDPVTLARVLLGHISGGPGHGSLYLRVARRLYGQQPGPLAGIEQAVVGIKLGLRYSAAGILELYANVTDFGHGYFGLAAASCGYFAERPAGLSWAQAAMLVAVARAPVADDPRVHRERARAGEAVVLGRLIATGQLTAAQAAAAYRQPLHLLHLRRGGTLHCAAA